MNPLFISWICDIEGCIKYPFMVLGGFFTFSGFVAWIIMTVNNVPVLKRGAFIFTICSVIALVIGILLPDPEILKCLLEQ